ncbi:adhesive plaque matrix protein-like [Penaeus japonicus]|uniref:adhesive plaque matrix protein-like n=1 Tax=Penaeus japonicus TaxID=27405 RepID=UPI001C715850|nr:adhesive plaque matrix protein-like [Penaeus japonicus]
MRSGKLRCTNRVTQRPRPPPIGLSPPRPHITPFYEAQVPVWTLLLTVSIASSEPTVSRSLISPPSLFPDLVSCEAHSTYQPLFSNKLQSEYNPDLNPKHQPAYESAQSAYRPRYIPASHYKAEAIPPNHLILKSKSIYKPNRRYSKEPTRKNQSEPEYETNFLSYVNHEPRSKHSKESTYKDRITQKYRSTVLSQPIQKLKCKRRKLSKSRAISESSEKPSYPYPVLSRKDKTAHRDKVGLKRHTSLSRYSGSRAGSVIKKPLQHSFDYAIKDDYSANDYGHQESRDGYNTQGSYYVPVWTLLLTVSIASSEPTVSRSLISPPSLFPDLVSCEAHSTYQPLFSNKLQSEHNPGLNPKHQPAYESAQSAYRPRYIPVSHHKTEAIPPKHLILKSKSIYKPNHRYSKEPTRKDQSEPEYESNFLSCVNHEPRSKHSKKTTYKDRITQKYRSTVLSQPIQKLKCKRRKLSKSRAVSKSSEKHSYPHPVLSRKDKTAHRDKVGRKRHTSLSRDSGSRAGSVIKKPLQHSFDYAIKDDNSATDYGHQESRDGYNTQGSYYVQLPDGRLQKVTYHVDGDSGFVAEVSYEGEAQYPHDQPAYKPAQPYKFLSSYMSTPSYTSRSTNKPVPTNKPTRPYKSRPTNKPAPTNKPTPSYKSRSTNKPAPTNKPTPSYKSRPINKPAPTNKPAPSYKSRPTNKPVPTNKHTPNYQPVQPYKPTSKDSHEGQAQYPPHRLTYTHTRTYKPLTLRQLESQPSHRPTENPSSDPSYVPPTTYRPVVPYKPVVDAR